MATKGAEKVESKVPECKTSLSSTPVVLEVTGQLQENLESLVMVSMNPGDSASRPPCDICCVVDVSGSMRSEAKTKNDKGAVESHGLRLLDIVRHAVKTVVMCLQPKDRLALVSFHNTAYTQFGLNYMDESGRDMAVDKIEKLQALFSTNLWAGLDMGLDVLRNESRKDANCTLFLLTDGVPTVIPPRGHIQMLKRYKDQYGLPCNIGTFGFGYNLDSQLLHDIAVEGNGMYAFILDSSFVGTTFVNAMSNSLSTVARNVELSVETQNGATLVSEGDERVLGGGYPCNLTGWGAQVSLGPLLYGQNRSIVFRIKIPADRTENMLAVTITYEECNGKTSKMASDLRLDQTVPELIKTQWLRSTFVQLTKRAIAEADKNIAIGCSTVQSLAKEFSTTDVKSKYISDLQKEVTGQITEAFSREDWYGRWGRHYLLSLTRAHLLQQCTNFKDPGLQHYGGSLFSEIRDFADEIFIKIPPPKRKMQPSTAVSAPLTSMSRYHSSGAPCFSGDSTVLLRDLSVKLVGEVVKGDFLKTPSSSGKVACVVKTFCSEGKTLLVDMDGLKITPWHPIRKDGNWKFPCEVVEPKETVCEAVYSFLLEDSVEDIVIVNGSECATLGHRYTGDVIGHPYFGSNRVREDLSKMGGWTSGCVELSDRNCLVKDGTIGLVTSLQQ